MYKIKWVFQVEQVRHSQWSVIVESCNFSRPPLYTESTRNNSVSTDINVSDKRSKVKCPQ